MPLLSAFHIHYDHWCPYASMIVVEMYTADTATGYAVRFVYNGESITVRAASLRLNCVAESLIIIFGPSTAGWVWLRTVRLCRFPQVDARHHPDAC